MTSMPLSGIRVLDLTRVLAGPWTAQTLADLGADVIKVERPGTGDESRIFGPPFLKDNEGKNTQLSAMFLAANRNKKSVVVDFSKPEGREVIRKLASTADVLIENYKVGDLKRFGLDYDGLKEANPKLVYCSITGFGQTGPYKQRRGYDPIAQAMSGIMSVTGFPGDQPGGGPMKAGPSVVDLFAACYAVIAIQGALYHREKNSGRGQYIDMSLLDAGVTLMAHPAMTYVLTGQSPGLVGTQANGGAPGGGFQCADGYIMVAPGNNELYVKFCSAIGMPEMATDERFVTNPKRMVNRAALMEILNAHMLKWKVRDLYDVLVKAGVPASPVNNVEDVFADPQVQNRQMVVDVPHPSAGNVKIVNNPIRYSDTPIGNFTAPPALGEHTDEVLSGVLGMTPAEIRSLRDLGAIG